VSSEDEEGEAHLSNAAKILKFMMNFFDAAPPTLQRFLYSQKRFYATPTHYQLAVSSEQWAVNS
jgi:hypothetical protein